MESHKKWHSCVTCGKLLSSYHSLWRHKRNRGSDPYQNVPDRYPIRDDKSPTLSSYIPTFNAANDDKMFTIKRPSNEAIHGSDKETGPTNPKIRALLDEIIDGSPPEKSPPSTISQANPQNAPVL